MKKTKVGIWLDYREANIITLKGKGATFHNKNAKRGAGKIIQMEWGIGMRKAS